MVKHRLTGHAYPWDVIGDPTFVDRVADLGLDEVTLAAHYHSVRAATPRHPNHQVVTAAHAALYRPLRPQAWRGRRLRPAEATWMADPDSFATSSATLRANGIPVNAWIVLNHNTRLGDAHPDVAVVNCFGDRYPYALCPQHAEVRDFAATLIAETLRDIEVDGVSLEAWGQLGVKHAGCHEKTAEAWSPQTERLLSICCCAKCRRAWTLRGLDADRVVTQLREAVVHLHDLASDVADALLATRHQAMADSLDTAVTAAAGASPGVRITAHAHPDVWSTSPLRCVKGAGGGEVAAVLLPAWSTDRNTAALIRDGRSQAPKEISVGAYVTVLPPADAAQLTDHVDRIIDAGADELHLYHLGLAGAGGQRDLNDLAAVWAAAKF